MRFFAHLACIVCLLIGLVACDHRPGDGYDPEGVTEGRYGGDSNNYGGDDSDNSGNEDSYCWEFIIRDGSATTTYYIWATESEARTIENNMRNYYSSVSCYRYYNIDSEYSCSQKNNQPDPEPEPEPEPEINLYTFIGSFSMSCKETYSGEIHNNEWNVIISTTSSKRYNGYSWVQIKGLYFGDTPYLSAYGYYDPKYQCIRIPADIKDTDNPFIFVDDEDTEYYAVFTPCYALFDSDGSFYHYHKSDDEMWLRVNESGRIVMTASEFPFTNTTRYGNAFTFFYYYSPSGEAPELNFFSVLTDVVLTRRSSYYEPAQAPRKGRNAIEKPLNKENCLQ